MENRRNLEKVWTAVDLYCGSGAVSQGLKQVGFKVLAAVDNDPVACKTYRMNHPEVNLAEGDIRSLKAADVCQNKSIDLLVVCAPCQPFSSQNRLRGSDDPRSDLVLECIKFVEQLTPNVVFFENVPGIALSGVSKKLSTKLSEYGYYLGEPRTLNAAHYNVPQRRVRSIMVASKSRELTEQFYASLKPSSKVTVRDAISGLRSLAAGQKDPKDKLHFARNHSEIALKRLSYIEKDGGSRFSIPYELQLNCHKDTKAYPDVYGRMKWDDVAPTLTTGCTDITRGRFAHPEDDRAISLREAALLQTFPREYSFYGNSGQIARQIGNAVPVNMICRMASSIMDCLSSSK
ncbi:DNA cytosine methyltransferase [Endozoicomonas numazuensis]|uniref:DNA cytosine methyltransferase n=1 Tax=Endozoicomonas numazuensis TaxID=1137799 RepID=UPI00054DA85E|nr:DNA cytosine methyltransferase [Endozoicomonas numazuensis]